MSVVVCFHMEQWLIGYGSLAVDAVAVTCWFDHNLQCQFSDPRIVFSMGHQRSCLNQIYLGPDRCPCQICFFV